MRLKTDIKTKEATFQVVLDALALTLFCQAFLITTEVPAIYIEIRQFFPKIIGQKFEDLPLEHDILSFIRDIGHTRDITYLTDIENKDAKKTNKMSYSRFTKIIIDYFMSKDQPISRRNKMFWHTAQDDTMFTSMNCISRHEDTQVYGTILPKELTNQAMLESKAYQTYYAFAFGEKALKPKLKSKAKVDKSDKKKQPAKMSKSKGLNVLSEVPDEQQQKVFGTYEGAGVTPEVPDVPKYDSESEEESWTFSQDDEDAEEESYMNDDNEETESDKDGDDLTHPNLSTYKKVSTPPDYELTEEEENKEDDNMDKEGDQEEEEDELYRDVNINLEKSDAEMTDAQANQDTEDTHVTLTYSPPVVQQQSSSVSSNLVSKFINPSPNTGIDSILYQDTQSNALINVLVSVAVESLYSVTTIP
ncbi:hypothetical protein Tco_1115284 [Tanacetum coccineum]